MAFKKFQNHKYPPRLWALVGYPGAGKSTFSTQLAGPLLPIDADGRFSEVLSLAQGDVYQLSDQASDNTDSEIIARLLERNMPGSEIGTIIIDSLTAIIAPLVTQAVRDNAAGRNKNRAAAFMGKALAMRTLQDAVSRWGCDVLWIYHLVDAMDAGAKEITRATLSPTERARLYRSLNLELHIIQEESRRGVKVHWARRGRAGMILWDDSGHWAGMPEKIEAAVYDGLTEADQAEIESTAPAAFPNPEAAIAWGLEQGAFDVLQHSRNAYNKLKADKQPANAAEMGLWWVEEIERRLEQKSAHQFAMDLAAPAEQAA